MLKGSILQKLQEAHSLGAGGQRSLNFGVYYKNTLVALCHALEDSILMSNANPLVITAFQQGKWYLQEADRYGEIADHAEQIVIMAAANAGFGEHPTSQLTNVALVDLDRTDPVAQEWHLIIVSHGYTAMVLCQELSPEDYGAAGVPNADLERKFYGFWTFEPTLVIETAALAIAHIERYDAPLHRTLSDHLSQIENQAQPQDVLCSLPTVENLGGIVARVVEYLQVSHDRAFQPSADLSDLAHPDKLDSNLLSNELQAFLRVAQLMDQSDVSNPMAGAEVAALSEALGQLLDLPAWQLHRMRLAGLLHRLALLQSATGVLSPGRATASEETSPAALSCPLVLGTQVLRTMPRLRAIATIITHQTEWWNGSGQPAGLTGDEIPLESRILGVASEFQYQLAQLQPSDLGADRFDGIKNAKSMDMALSACSDQAGDRWDPKLVDALTLMVSGLKQGLNLSVSMPKIAAGLWLLDSHSDEELVQMYSGMKVPESSGSSIN